MSDGWSTNPVAGGNRSIVGGWNGNVSVGKNDVVHDDDEHEEVMAVCATSAPAETVLGIAAASVSDVDIIRHFLSEICGGPEAIMDAGSLAGLF